MVNNMKISKKVIIWTLILSIFAVIGFGFLYKIINDNTRLTPKESEWINENLNKVINVTVLNDTNLFGMNGKGLFYDFLNDFSENYGLRFNSITYNSNENPSGIRFGISNVLSDSEINFYQDHYVLVSKKNEVILSFDDLKDKSIGVVADSFAYIQNQLSVSANFVSFPSQNELLKAFESGKDIAYMMVPRIEYMDTILSKDYRIAYHFTNINRYYYMSLDEQNQNLLSSILRKYFTKWKDTEFNDSFHSQEFQMFVNHLSITQTEVDQLQSVVYQYGFITNHPYEVLMGGNYGGMLAVYFNEFSKFSNVEFNFKRYKNYKKLTNAIQDKKVDLYFGYQNFTSGGEDISSDIVVSYDILVPESDYQVVSSFESLKGKTIYVEKNTLLESRMKTLERVEVLTYEGEKGLKDVVRKKGIVVMDAYLSQYYQNGILKNYTVRYHDSYPEHYFYKSHVGETFNQLFSRYVDYLDENVLTYEGLYHHNVTMKHGTILSILARYSLYIIVIFIILFILIYRFSKRIRLAKRLSSEDKLKFIDQLTSLKNRNYLNYHINQWNKNTIYPQTMLVIDLNRIQEINDTYGYEEGDNQIKHAANILIKTQLDNTDVMRTDGNEFMIYFVGYQMKQITAYIHKLNKEFKNLPYPYGACIGYSMIENDMKLVEDAINEATIDVKKQKGSKKEDVS